MSRKTSIDEDYEIIMDGIRTSTINKAETKVVRSNHDKSDSKGRSNHDKADKVRSNHDKDGKVRSSEEQEQPESEQGKQTLMANGVGGQGGGGPRSNSRSPRHGNQQRANKMSDIQVVLFYHKNFKHEKVNIVMDGVGNVFRNNLYGWVKL